MYRSLRLLRAPAGRDAQPSRAKKFACALLILFTVAAILHVHSNNKLDVSRPCPACAAIHSAIVTAILVAIVSATATPRPFALEDSEHVSPLLISDLFIRPPPAV
jgi:hypothetical protein